MLLVPHVPASEFSGLWKLYCPCWMTGHSLLLDGWLGVRLGFDYIQLFQFLRITQNYISLFISFLCCSCLPFGVCDSYHSLLFFLNFFSPTTLYKSTVPAPIDCVLFTPIIFHHFSCCNLWKVRKIADFILLHKCDSEYNRETLPVFTASTWRRRSMWSGSSLQCNFFRYNGQAP